MFLTLLFNSGITQVLQENLLNFWKWHVQEIQNGCCFGKTYDSLETVWFLNSVKKHTILGLTSRIVHILGQWPFPVIFLIISKRRKQKIHTIPLRLLQIWISGLTASCPSSCTFFRIAHFPFITILIIQNICNFPYGFLCKFCDSDWESHRFPYANLWRENAHMCSFLLVRLLPKFFTHV